MLIDGTVAYSKPVSFDVRPVQTYSDINYPWKSQEFTDPFYGYKKICDEFINYGSGRFGLVRW